MAPSAPSHPPRRRADAERSIAAILDAAVDVLGERPDASMSRIAAAANVTRQTVYAHYASREALIEAVGRRARAQTLEAIDAARPDEGDAAEALRRLVTRWWGPVARHARVVEALIAVSPGSTAMRDFHAPIAERLDRLVRRGQRERAFDGDLAPEWLVSAFLGLMHTAADEVASGRLTAGDAERALQRTVPRVFGVA